MEKLKGNKEETSLLNRKQKQNKKKILHHVKKDTVQRKLNYHNNAVMLLDSLLHLTVMFEAIHGQSSI